MDTKTTLSIVGAGAALLVAGGLYMAGINPLTALDGDKKGRTVTANIATFDPDADVNFDLDAYGSERVDEYQVQEAFNASFEKMDTCVWDYKETKGLTEETLGGDVKIAIKLNPKKDKPFAVNAELPKAFSKDKKLNNCLREAAASVAYPTYDGPPQVAEFEFELDPGYE